ncbi:MAG: HNH endonuclease [Nitrososphaeraceae archaeon]
MFDTADNAHNVCKKTDYSTVRSIVIRSLEKIVREEINRHSSQRRVNLNKMEEEEDVVVIADTKHLFDNDTILSPSLLKLRIRNTTEYLNWRIAILRRDNFRCQICTASIKDNKSVRLEVHHAKTFDDICKENNITTMKGALTRKEIWSLDNGISLCHGCHKNIERIRTELKNMFVI